MYGLPEILIIGFLLLFVVFYRNNKGENFYIYVSRTANNIYDKYTPYSFKVIREKTKELGKEYTPRQYLIQAIFIAGGAGLISWWYFYDLVFSIIYAVVSVLIIPYLSYLRYKKVYSEFIFEQIQVYTTNVIMEFNTTQSFVKSLEGVRDSGILEEPVLSDVKEMIGMSYANGSIEESIDFMNEKYPFYMVKNMHQLFLQITKEGAKDSGESLENMQLDIDMLVEDVYRDRIDRANFHKQFVFFGLLLYCLPALVQYMLGNESYLQLIETWYVSLLLHLVLIINSFFLLSGEKYYNEDVGAE